jgi:hypothetical protein
VTPAVELDPALHGALRLSLALLLLAACQHKLRDFAGFRAALAEYRLLPARWASAGAALLLLAELATGLALLLPGSARGAALAAALLLLLYSVAIGINLARGRREIDCGCAGPGARRPLSEALIARNALLIAVATACTLTPAARPLVWVDALTVAGGAALLALLYGALDAALENAPRLRELRGGTWSMP